MDLVALGQAHLGGSCQPAAELDAERWWAVTAGLGEALDLCSGELPVWVEDSWSRRGAFEGLVYSSHRVLSPWGSARYADLKRVERDDGWFGQAVKLGAQRELKLPGELAPHREAFLEAVMGSSGQAAPLAGADQLVAQDPRPAALLRVVQRSELPQREAEFLERAAVNLSRALRWGGQSRGNMWSCPLPEGDLVHALFWLLGRAEELKRSPDRLELFFDGTEAARAVARKQGTGLAVAIALGVDLDTFAPNWRRLRATVMRHTDATLVALQTQERFGGWAALEPQHATFLSKGLNNALLELGLVRALDGMGADLDAKLRLSNEERAARLAELAPGEDRTAFLLTR